MPKTITLTMDLIEACESEARTWSRASMEALGTRFNAFGHPVKGWKSELVGKQVSTEDYQRALEGRSKAFFRHEEQKKQMSLF